MLDLDRLLRFAVEQGASDVHVKVGARPRLRVDGVLRRGAVRHRRARGDRAVRASRSCPRCARSSSAARTRPTSCTASPGSAGSGSSAFRQRGWVGLVLRRVLPGIPGFDALSMPAAVAALADQAHGLVLVSGLAGSGKTATLAAMVDHVNSTRRMPHRHDRRPGRGVCTPTSERWSTSVRWEPTRRARVGARARAPPGPRRDHGERDRATRRRRGPRCKRRRPVGWCLSSLSTVSVVDTDGTFRRPVPTAPTAPGARLARRRAARRRLATPARARGRPRPRACGRGARS